MFCEGNINQQDMLESYPNGQVKTVLREKLQTSHQLNGICNETEKFNNSSDIHQSSGDEEKDLVQVTLKFNFYTSIKIHTSYLIGYVQANIISISYDKFNFFQCKA